ncbi:hypothetical protein DUNSADRAFT_6572 [Dunaliella salina]|uniref:glucose-1-phosphate adenylyltransferase n=1 Tax=Dunaliella salina TaxID=3046 RepID=A0ABQ7GN16_DUNSA|nr:hypothetical protein DUNSADRAFT_6572 [Dunaliella salina]|eukprot:KAF5836001.1 hypothetical protein DUNSADRAFT_6572 [Dunaliella salina]
MQNKMIMRTHVKGATLSERGTPHKWSRQCRGPASLASKSRALGASAYKEQDGRESGEGQGQQVYELKNSLSSSSSVAKTLLSPAETGRGSSIAMVLGGGPQDYTKLYPLTEKRALPAVPVGGSYRLVDIPISNLFNSGINKLYIITQFNSQSLNRHLTRTYSLPGGLKDCPKGHGGIMC